MTSFPEISLLGSRVEYFTKFPSTVIIGKKAEFCIQFEDVEKYESNININIASHSVTAFNPVNLIIGYKSESNFIKLELMDWTSTGSCYFS